MIIRANPFPIFPKWIQIKNKKKKEQRYTITAPYHIEYDLQKKAKIPYYNHIETAGFYHSAILFYGIQSNKKLRLAKHLVFPTFRKKENDTRGSFSIYVEKEFILKINHELIKEEQVQMVTLDGFIHIKSKTLDTEVQRTFFAASDAPAFITKIQISNHSPFEQKIEFHTPSCLFQEKPQNCDQDRPYQILSQICFDTFDSKIENEMVQLILKPKQGICLYHVIACRYLDEQYTFSCAEQENKRLLFLNQMQQQVELKTNHPVLDTMFYFAKIRVNESIFKTKAGYLHSPGGGNYYAAIWTNDQLEYANPCFAYFSYYPAYASCIRSMDLYEPYMYKNQALVTSIIAEGTSFWNGAKDRGDGAMYAYGASSFLLIIGNKELAQAYVKPIQWCLDYTLNKINEQGVIESDTDELENRFESGKANLATNAIAYAALNRAANLFNALNIPQNYKEKAEELKRKIDEYFFGQVEGYFTYQYCKEEKHLRVQMCYPLMNGILTKKEGVVSALIHSPLWTQEGFLTTTASDVFWDRSTLMAIRAMYCAKDSINATKFLLSYSLNRLLTDHVPYAIEAYPEGNQAQLSAESALYIRIFVEGILGFVPHSFSSFYLKPSLCKTLSYIEINHLYLCNKKINIHATLLKDQRVELVLSGDIQQKHTLSNYQQILIELG